MIKTGKTRLTVTVPDPRDSTDTDDDTSRPYAWKVPRKAFEGGDDYDLVITDGSPEFWEQTDTSDVTIVGWACE